MAPRATLNVPINHAAVLAAEAAEILKRFDTPSGDRIRYIGGSAFKTPDGQTGTSLEVVILDFVSANTLYEGAYDRNNPGKPVCAATGLHPSLLTPFDTSPKPQAASCSVCPNNQFRSAGKGKACKNTQLLAVTPVASLDNPETVDVWILAVPPTSIRNFSNYAANLASVHKTLPVGVVTTIGVTTDAKYASPTFTLTRPLKPKELELCMNVRASASTRLLAAPNMEITDAPPPPPVKTPVRRK